MDAFNRVKVWFMVTGALVVGMILFIILFPTIRAFFWSAAYSPGTSSWIGLKDIILFSPLVILVAGIVILIIRWWRTGHSSW
jgi:hypothetical protein